jgi:hypothetical protein
MRGKKMRRMVMRMRKTAKIKMKIKTKIMMIRVAQRRKEIFYNPSCHFIMTDIQT